MALQPQNTKKALSTHATTKIVDLMVDRSLGEAQKRAYSYSLFVRFCLPARSPQRNDGVEPRFWTRKFKDEIFEIGRHENFGIPYGVYARQCQIFIDSEIILKKSNIIDLGDSWRDFLEKLGYTDGGARYALAAQLTNLLTCSFRVDSRHFPGVRGNFFISNVTALPFDVRNPDQQMLFGGKVRLNADYVQQTMNHGVPLDLDLLRAFKNNCLALDFYRFLAYRNNELNSKQIAIKNFTGPEEMRPVSLAKKLYFHDELLFDQLGYAPEHHRDARKRLKVLLKAIKHVWSVDAGFKDGFFYLNPSEPSVKQ